MTRFYRQLFLNARFYLVAGCCVLLYVLAFFFPWLGELPDVVFFAALALVFSDLFLLFKFRDGLFAHRVAPPRLSNGDENEILVSVENFYPFTVQTGIIDEVPVQFQKRDAWFRLTLPARQSKILAYKLLPLKRGEYTFGDLRVFVSSPLGLVSRRYTFKASQVLPVYPSFLQMRKYELMAISNRLSEIGVKKIRRIGNSLEFEQIRQYIPGDDYRSMNWKATARAGGLMVNNYIEERAQNVYCIIDKSRAMKMPFDGLSLLDYAINATLVLSNIALYKEDKAGLITIGAKLGTVIPAARRPTHLNRIMEVLYREKTRYQELHMEALYHAVRHTVKQRSLLVLFTNFESVQAMRRQLPYLKRMAQFHLLLVVFFENSELKNIATQTVGNVEDIYIKTVAKMFAFEKKQMLLELASHGIQALLTPPQNLTVNTINKYLEIKAKGGI